jgi:hypothetical protein
MRDSRAAQSRLGDADARRHGKKTWCPVCMSHRPCASLGEVVPLCLSPQWMAGWLPLFRCVQSSRVRVETSRVLPVPVPVPLKAGKSVSRLAPRLPDDLDLTTTFLWPYVCRGRAYVYAVAGWRRRLQEPTCCRSMGKSRRPAPSGARIEAPY